MIETAIELLSKSYKIKNKIGNEGSLDQTKILEVLPVELQNIIALGFIEYIRQGGKYKIEKRVIENQTEEQSSKSKKDVQVSEPVEILFYQIKTDAFEFEIEEEILKKYAGNAFEHIFKKEPQFELYKNIESNNDIKDHPEDAQMPQISNNSQLDEDRTTNTEMSLKTHLNVSDATESHTEVEFEPEIPLKTDDFGDFSPQEATESKVAVPEPLILSESTETKAKHIVIDPEKEYEELRQGQKINLANEIKTINPLKIDFSDDIGFTKKKDTFLFNVHELTITEKNKVPYTIFAFIYPKGSSTMDNNFQDIVVCLKLDNIYRMGQSSKKTKAVDLEIKGIRFVIRGSFVDGNFVTKVNSMNPEIELKDEIENIVPKNRTSSFYKILKLEDFTLELFPLSLRNGNDGLTPSIGYMRDENRIIFPDNTNNITVITDNVTNIITYWQGDEFVCSIE